MIQAGRYNGGLFKSLADALAAYGLPGIFLIATVDSMGIPLPAAIDAMLLTIALTAPGEAYWAAALAVAGSLVGNVLLFRASWLGGQRLLKEETPAGKPQRFRQWFQRYGLLTIFIPAVTPFVPLPLKVFVISAGAMRTPMGRFLGVLLFARVIRYFGQAYLYIRLGHDAGSFLRDNKWNMAGIMLVLAFLFVSIVKLYDRRTRLQAEPRP